MDGRWRRSSTRIQSGGWVMGGAQVSGVGQVKSASRTEARDPWTPAPGCVWVSWVFWAIWVIWEAGKS